VPLSDWLSKRITGAANLLFRRRRQFRSVRFKLEKLSQLTHEQAVDFVLCTGDYTLFGTDPELRDARLAIQPLVEASRGFITVPGNHDLYTHRVVREERFPRHFGDLMQSDDPELAVGGPWPIVRWLGEAAVVIAVNSSRPHRLPWRSSGRISETELEALNELLEIPRVRDRFVFVMTHHAPLLANGRPDRRHRRLHNADEFLTVCSKIERGAVLFGHVHHCYRLTLSELRAPLFNAGSATVSLHEGLWMFDVNEDTVQVRRGRWSGDHYSLEPSETLPA
jgi:3',5'-cyclic AMP phosphodiesterase CpdA